MPFDWDEAKNRTNMDKNGISFEEATALWNDPYMIAVPVVRNGERRTVALARMWGTCWLAAYRQDGDDIRLVSVRRATKKEAAAYDKANS